LNPQNNSSGCVNWDAIKGKDFYFRNPWKPPRPSAFFASKLRSLQKSLERDRSERSFSACIGIPVVPVYIPRR
jgi:hypothetical protein